METKQRKKLLIYAHYYWPDVASTGQILQDLAESMTDVFDITVICAVPSYTGIIPEQYRTKSFYEEEHNGVHIVRVSVPSFDKETKFSRIRNIVTYFFRARKMTRRLRRRGKQDYVFAISQPPILGGLLGVYGKKKNRAKLIYNIQDFNPEQTIAVNYSRAKPMLALMMKLDKYSCKKADKVILVGRDMVKTLEDRFRDKKIPPHTIINNFVDENLIHPLSPREEKVVEFKRKYGLEQKFVFMYSGNIGLYYDLENLLRVIKTFRRHEEVAFVFVGAGSLEKKLLYYKKKHVLKNVYFIPYQSKDELVYSLNAADVHFVINAKGIKGISVPSKFYGVMAVGKPAFVVLEQGSEARCVIEEAGCGVCCEPGDYESIDRIIRGFLSGEFNAEEMGRKGRTYLEAHLSKSISVQRYIDEILST